MDYAVSDLPMTY